MTPSPFARAVLVSDSHGYLDLLVEVLASAGIVDGVIPADTQLIHLGDTVDRGPDSPGVFNLVRDLQRNHAEGQVIRLVGNHEFTYCGGPVFYNSPRDEKAVMPLAPLMREDGKSGALSFAYALKAGDTEWLCVHGGLDPRLVAEDDESTAQELADHINGIGLDFFRCSVPRWRTADLTTEQRQQQAELEKEAAILTGISRVRGGYEMVSGVTWCDMIEELLPQEDKIKVPQIVGHRSHDEIHFSEGGKVIGINLHYGSGQALLVDLTTGEMAATEVRGGRDPRFYG